MIITNLQSSLHIDEIGNAPLYNFFRFLSESCRIKLEDAALITRGCLVFCLC